MSLPTPLEEQYPKTSLHWLQTCSVRLCVKAWRRGFWNAHWEGSGRSVAAAMFVCDDIQTILSYLPREQRCYLDWPFPLQVTGCRLAGERSSGSTIRPDQNCRVWCSLYRCHQHQTVRCPHQVRRSSMKQRDWRWSDSKLHSSISPVSPLPLWPLALFTSFTVCVFLCRCRGVGRCRCLWQPGGGRWWRKMNGCKWINPEQLSH